MKNRNLPIVECPGHQCKNCGHVVDEESAFKEGFVDGFLATGEGFNGEYCRTARDIHNVSRVDVERIFEEEVMTDE